MGTPDSRIPWIPNVYWVCQTFVSVSDLPSKKTVLNVKKKQHFQLSNKSQSAAELWNDNYNEN